MKYAKLQILRILYRTKILSSQVYTGKVVPEFHNQNIRELLEGNYGIIYKIVSDDRIDILTIRHAARDLTRRNIE